MTDNQFVSGLYWNDPHPNAPEWVKGNISIKVNDFIAYLKANHPTDSEYIKVSLNVSKDGQKMYFKLDTWKKDQANQPAQSTQPAQQARPDANTPPPMTDDEYIASQIAGTELPF